MRKGGDSRSRAASRKRAVDGAPVPELAGARAPAGAVDGDVDARLGRVARARRVGELRLAAGRGQAKVAGGAAVAVRRAASRRAGAGVALVGAGLEVAARLVRGDGAGLEDRDGVHGGRGGDGGRGEGAEGGEEEDGEHLGGFGGGGGGLGGRGRGSLVCVPTFAVEGVWERIPGEFENQELGKGFDAGPLSRYIYGPGEKCSEISERPLQSASAPLRERFPNALHPDMTWLVYSLQREDACGGTWHMRAPTGENRVRKADSHRRSTLPRFRHNVARSCGGVRGSWGAR